MECENTKKKKKIKATTKVTFHGTFATKWCIFYIYTSNILHLHNVKSNLPFVYTSINTKVSLILKILSQTAHTFN